MVAAGLFSAVKAERGKPAAKQRFLELIESGWSTAQAATEVGVNVRTARDWRDGVRKTVQGGQIRADGTVVEYRVGKHHAGPVPEISNDAPMVFNDRFDQ
ncbi:helix-turn-helix domain-containing protein [Nocardia sp. NPDC004278]